MDIYKILNNALINKTEIAKMLWKGRNLNTQRGKMKYKIERKTLTEKEQEKIKTYFNKQGLTIHE